MPDNSTNKKIAKNTLVLYVRMLLSMLVTLFTSRVVLNALGVQDFGIYNVVGGIIVMLGFFNSAMTASTQRFLTFELGKNDITQLRKTFNMSSTVHAIIAVIVLILAETVGLYFLNHYLHIPAQRMYAANWVYQFTIFAFIVTVISVPYNAAIIANERMNLYAFVGLFEVFAKLAIAFILTYGHFDKLIVYAILLFLVAVIIRIIEGIYCKKHFVECSEYKLIWDKEMFNRLGSFASWNLLGVSAGIGYNQGVNILLNIFFGPTVNAARGIAYQVQGALTNFVTNFQVAVNPAITKAYAQDKISETLNLVFAASKFSFYLLLFLSLPIIVEAQFILQLWLKTVPSYTVTFTQLVLLDVLIGSISGALQSLAQATGNIRRYQLVISGILLLNLPTSYVLLKMGFSPQVTVLVSISFTIVALIARLGILKDIASLPVFRFTKTVLLQAVMVAILAFMATWYTRSLLTNQGWQFIFTCVVSSFSIIILIVFLGLNSFEKQAIKNLYYKKILKKT
ncbi:lipopolysaccharide biosynthesis protein [Mucilaginibacter achroorhodeus]|uniref:Lipopolysaccharide biosynthesis protein n=1 Tax=Mucilaginibacter achroorhodeus TaxID=2599294 RepID=A0A563U9K0_9SPHI|nr:lipopolysaccharide biosynthesis protein [Mucilaginibacter achroorhodeus]TWR28010.1 lipopolysaccharide biosynthesis protein [Mucilaginibacter achroorhodeus]